MALLADALADLRHTIAASERQLAERTAERDEALAQQSTTAEILRAIARSPGDVRPVFETIVASAVRVCEAEFSGVAQRDAADAAFRAALRVTTRDLGNAVAVRVRDNGVGVPPEFRDKPFQTFLTTKPTGKGTGFGLSISYDIVTQQHGGDRGRQCGGRVHRVYDPPAALPPGQPPPHPSSACGAGNGRGRVALSMRR